MRHPRSSDDPNLRHARHCIARGMTFDKETTVNRKYLAFDIEIAQQLPEGAPDWKAHRPLGITCAATMPSDAVEPRLWYAVTEKGLPDDRMTTHDAAHLVNHLKTTVAKGYTILTWNGLGLDFDILAEESGLYKDCKQLALENHVDMMFHVVCELGYPVALDKAAKGMGLPGKPEGIDGALAPLLWADGKRQIVLDYVAQDVRTTLDLAQVCAERKRLHWITRKGTIRGMPLRKGWLTVREAFSLPEPDTSWMRNPMPRSTFADWMD